MAKYDWIDFYQELADKILNYKNKRQELLAMFQMISAQVDLKLPAAGKDASVTDLDPFTAFGVFNRRIGLEKRIHILKELKKELGVSAKLPSSFEGIPLLNNLRSSFSGNDSQKNDDVIKLWEVFEAAIRYADLPLDSFRRGDFIEKYNQVKDFEQNCWKYSMAFFWIRPSQYINLDKRNRDFMSDPRNIDENIVQKILALRNLPDGETYLTLCDDIKEALVHGEHSYKDFSTLSEAAWQSRNDRADTSSTNSLGEINETRRIWLYAPGKNASQWESNCRNGEMAIGWPEVGNLEDYESKDDIHKALKDAYPESTSSSTHDRLALWQFAHEIKVGDIVYAKKGTSIIVGRGKVVSEYIYDETRGEYCNIRKVEWTDKGKWRIEKYLPQKTLTDYTSDNDFCEKIDALFGTSDFESQDKNEDTSYSREKFLDEVYMSADYYDNLVKLLETKKNIVLQGAPGVGKTFAAIRLAYSIIGERDASRVKMIQFHQNYSYEDFIEGYRPSDSRSESKDRTTGFRFDLKKGTFYKFCKKAEEDKERRYFFIIDEINRGNVSKIFGELFMLLESDKRQDVKLQLLYSYESFTIPSNVYVIGMMNTADRSLAMLDYALRRRFAFVELEPQFDSEQFKKYQSEVHSKCFEQLIKVVKNLNQTITKDESLGRGYRIGHSYFCGLNDLAESEVNARLSNIVEYELIPALEEYWFDDRDKVEDWTNNLRSALK